MFAVRNTVSLQLILLRLMTVTVQQQLNVRFVVLKQPLLMLLTLVATLLVQQRQSVMFAVRNTVSLHLILPRLMTVTVQQQLNVRLVVLKQPLLMLLTQVELLLV